MPSTTATPEATTETIRAAPITAGLESAEGLDQALARPEQLLVRLQNQVGNQAVTSAVQRAPGDEVDGGGVALAERLPSPDDVASELTGAGLDGTVPESAGAPGSRGPTDGGSLPGGLDEGSSTGADASATPWPTDESAVDGGTMVDGTGDAIPMDGGTTVDGGTGDITSMEEGTPAGVDRPPEGELRSGGADVERALSGGGPPVDAGTPAGATARDGSAPAMAGPDGGAARTAGTPAPERVGGGPADAGGGPTDALAADDAEIAAGVMDGALVETELAEHERWGSAAATVGGAQSAERAGFIAEQVGGGMGEGFESGAVAGAMLGFGTKAAVRLASRRIPIPIIGSIIGGAIGFSGLLSQLGEEGRAEIGNKLGAIGEGASGYEAAANTIDGLITILDVAANLLDTVGLVCGVIAAVAWLGAIPSFGATSPIAATCTSIATAVGVASTVLSLVKMGLTPLVMLFRSLHTFTTDADPREVQAQGSALADTGRALGGTLGGLVGTKAGEAVGTRGANRLGLPPESAAARYVDRPAGGGDPDGPRVETAPRDDPRTSLDRAMEGIDRPEGHGWGEPFDPADPRNPLRGASDAEIDAALREPGMSEVDRATQSLDRPETGWGEPFDPADPRNPMRGASEADLEMGAGIRPVPEPVPSVIVDPSIEGVTTTPAPARPVDTRPQTDVDWYDPVTNPTGTVHPDDVRAMAPRREQLGNWHPDQLGEPLADGGYRGELGQMETVVDPSTGRPMLDRAGRPIREFTAEGVFQAVPDGSHAVRSGNPGGWADAVYPAGRPGFDDASAAADAAAAHGSAGIRDDSALPVTWPGGGAGNPVDDMHVYPVTNPRNNPAVSPDQPHRGFDVPTIQSTVAPQPEASPAPGRPSWYPGGGPQTQVPGWHVPVENGPREDNRPFMTNQDPVTGAPLTTASGAPLPSTPIAQTVVNPLSPDHWARRAEDWGNRTSERRVLGPTVERWDAGMDAAQLGDLSKKALAGPEAAARSPFAADDAPFADVAEEQRTGADANVERVDPDYERPPGTPEQLAAMRAEIAHMRAAERLSGADAAVADADRAETARRAEQIDLVSGDVAVAKDATEAQQSDVAATAEANTGQQGRQEEAGTDLSQSASRLAGLGTLETLLAGWAAAAGATAGVFYLIGNVIDSANSAGDKCGASAADALTFMEKLVEAKMLVGGEAARSPMEMGRLNQERAALDAEAQRAAATEGELGTAREGVDAAADQNAADATAAADSRSEARSDEEEAAAAAEARQAEHDQLESDLQAWAERHAQSRHESVQATVQRITDEGYEVAAVHDF